MGFICQSAEQGLLIHEFQTLQSEGIFHPETRIYLFPIQLSNGKPILIKDEYKTNTFLLLCPEQKVNNPATYYIINDKWQELQVENDKLLFGNRNI